MLLTVDSEDPVGQIKYAVEQGIPVLYEGIVQTQIFGQLSHLLSRQTFQVRIGHECASINAMVAAIQGEIRPRNGTNDVLPEIERNHAHCAGLDQKTLRAVHHAYEWIRAQRHHMTFVHVGDTAVLYNEGFRIYITTRDERPELMPDVSMWVSLVDFDLTAEGLNQVNELDTASIRE